MRSHVKSDANYFASMTDMTIGVLFILIIMIAYFAHQNQTQNPIQIYIDRGEQERKGIARTVAQGLRERNIDAIVSPKNPGVVTLRGANLFGSGESELTPAAKETISFLAQVLKKETSCYVVYEDAPIFQGSCNLHRVVIEAIFIEGHTDDRPVTAALKDGSKNNLELSARRATNTHDTLTRAEPKLSEFRNLDKEPVLSVAAYGEQRPLVANIDESARDRNRRIDVRFVMWVPKSVESYNNQIRRIEELRISPK
jgi:chemotaxis protein MotB